MTITEPDSITSRQHGSRSSNQQTAFTEGNSDVESHIRQIKAMAAADVKGSGLDCHAMPLAVLHAHWRWNRAPKTALGGKSAHEAKFGKSAADIRNAKRSCRAFCAMPRGKLIKSAASPRGEACTFVGVDEVSGAFMSLKAHEEMHLSTPVGMFGNRQIPQF